MVAIGLACILVSNQGLAQLIALSGPVLVGIYPLAIALVVLSLLSGLWRNAQRVFAPVLAVALVFGLVDAAKAAGWQDWLPAFLNSLPGNGMGLGPARGSHPGAGSAPRPAAPGPGHRVQAVLKRAMSSTS